MARGDNCYNCNYLRLKLKSKHHGITVKYNQKWRFYKKVECFVPLNVSKYYKECNEPEEHKPNSSSAFLSISSLHVFWVGVPVFPECSVLAWREEQHWHAEVTVVCWLHPAHPSPSPQCRHLPPRPLSRLATRAGSPCLRRMHTWARSKDLFIMNWIFKK